MSTGSRSSLRNLLLNSPSVLPMVFFALSEMVIFSLWNTSDQAWIDSRTAIPQQLGSSWEIMSLAVKPFDRETLLERVREILDR